MQKIWESAERFGDRVHYCQQVSGGYGWPKRPKPLAWCSPRLSRPFHFNF